MKWFSLIRKSACVIGGTARLRLLLAATVVMAVMVVTINRLIWRPLYALASTRFKLEG